MTNEELVQKYYLGDTKALDPLCQQISEMIHSLAFNTARQFHRPDAEDLYNVGMLKLIELLNSRSYDPCRAKLSTYLYPHIQGAMRRWLEQNTCPISLDQLTEDSFDFSSGVSLEYTIYRKLLIELV